MVGQRDNRREMGEAQEAGPASEEERSIMESMRALYTERWPSFAVSPTPARFVPSATCRQPVETSNPKCDKGIFSPIIFASMKQQLS